MEIICTRPSCGASNHFDDLDDPQILKTTQQKFCTQCGMPLILGGRYLPSKLLGKGGFGAAFLASDRYTTKLRQCVVKILQPAGDLSPEQLEIAQSLFEREAAVLEDIGNHHPQIPDSFAFFPLLAHDRAQNKDTQFFYLVQEFIDGLDLEQEFAQKGIYSEAEVLEVLREILRILDFVHHKGVIHRDIKPSNIMRSRQGILYLLDFGAVKQVTTGAAGGAAQGRSTGIYSLGFAPPEQMQGAQVYPSTDLYALAATCLVLLTGQPPNELFDAYNNRWAWRDHAPQVGDRLAIILDKMLQATPKDRFPSAQVVLDFLDRAFPPAATGQPARQQMPPVKPTSLQPSASPPSPVRATPPQPVLASPPVARFSTGEMLACAAFTGFESTLLFIIGMGFLGGGLVGLGLWAIAIAGLIYGQARRILTGKDLPILAIITLILTIFVPLPAVPVIAFALEQIALGKIMGLLFLGVLGGSIVVMITALFRLIYQILLSIF